MAHDDVFKYFAQYTSERDRSIDRWKITLRQGDISSASSLRTRAWRLSGPLALEGSRLFRSFVIPFVVILISDNTGLG